MAKSSRSGSNPTKAMNPRVAESFEMLPSTRSLLPPSFGQQPWLIQLHVAAKHIQTFINPFNGSNEKRSIDKMQRKLCLGCFGDWILLVDIFTKGMVLLDLTSDTEIKLPPFPKSFYDLGCFAISSCPTSPGCVIVMAGRYGAYLLYCQLKEQKWNETNHHDFFNIMVERCFNGDIAISQGKIYAFVYSWVAWNVMVIDLELLLTGVVECNLVPVPKCFHDAHDYINRIVVSGENVFFVTVRFSLGVVIDAEIHILDKSKLTRKKYDPWMTVDSINRRVFFLGSDYNTSFSVNLMGMPRNIIYVLRKECGGQRLHTICLDDQTTSSKLLLPGATDKWDKLYWVVPSRSRSAVWGVTESSTIFLSEDDSSLSNEEPEIGDDISAPWPDMPADLIDTVLQSLSLADRICMASVCKSWNTTYNSMLESKCFPWLLHFPLDTSCCKLLDPFHGQEHSISMKWVRTEGRLRLHYSNHGWILVSDRSCLLFILNPLTREVIELPPLGENELRSMSFSFSLVPTSLDCVVFGTFGSTIKAWCRGWVNWCESKVEGMSAENEFRASFGASPVVFRGKLYCLGIRGHLVVYDPEKNIAQLLKKPERLHSRWEKGPGENEFYLLELDKELVCIFKGRKQKYVSVYKLNESKKAWFKLQCLGNKTVFLSRRGALWRLSEKEYANGILFPRLNAEKNNGMAFYSMEDCAFPANFDDMKELMNCAWFEPNLTMIQKSDDEGDELEGM